LDPLLRRDRADPEQREGKRMATSKSGDLFQGSASQLDLIGLLKTPRFLGIFLRNRNFMPLRPVDKLI
jgi:hypothetical protein